LARGEAPDYSRFFARRLLRTLPAYLAIVALYFVFPVVRERGQIQPLWQFLTFTQNFALDFPLPKAFSHAWSLCVEEQFYLALPLVAAPVALRASARKVVGLIIAILFLGVALRGFLWLRYVAEVPFDPAAQPNPFRYMTLIYYPTWTRLDGLLAGVVAAAIEIFRPRLWRRLTARPNALLAAGVLGVAAAMALFRTMVAGFAPTTFGFPLLACSMAMLVIAGSDARSLIGRYPVPGAGAMAAGAYSLYLSNKIVFHAVQMAARGWPDPLRSFAFVAALLAVLAAGAALYWLVERPFLRLRDRLRAPPRSGPAAISVAASEQMSAR
jgi:peptidoglycan/LPS O-acetylase OafA/YrhL